MIRRDDLQDLYPLTPMQEGMLFHGVLDPGSRAYHVQVLHRLRGPLDPALLLRAWEALAAAHPILRTVFRYRKSRRPLQLVLREPRTTLEVRDLAPLDEDVRAGAVEEARRQDLDRGFALEEAPPWRVTVLRHGPELHEVLWSFHHLLLDGWSTGILLGDLAATYRDLRAGGCPALPARPPFARYLTWLDEQDRARSVGYWREALAGFEGHTSPAPDAPPREGVPYQDGEHGFALAPEALGRLRAVARDLGVTENVLLQTAWGVLLGRTQRSRDVVFGSIESGRPPELAGAEEMVGLFVNVAPTRVRFAPEEPFAAVCQRVQARWVEARDHLYLPLAETGAAAAVGHVFAYESYPIEAPPEADAGGPRIEGTRVLERTHYPFTVTVTPGEELRVKLLFDRSLHRPASVEALGAAYQTLLGAIAAAPERPVRDLALLDPTTERRVLDDWGSCPSGAPREGTLPALLEEVAAARPDAPAVTDGARRLTYRELSGRAGALAAELGARGLGPEEVVGVCLPRSAAMVAALAGVVAAGGAYLGLDPSWPDARLAQVLEDAGVRVVLTAPGEAKREAFAGREVLPLDLDTSWPEPDAPEPPPPRLGPDALAYVSYTSGTTGTPKGVQVPHRGVVRLVRGSWFADPGPEDVVLFASVLSFDASTFELWGALLNGAELVVCPEAPSLEEIAGLVSRHRVTVLFLTTGLFHAMVEERPEFLRGLRLALAGGDELSPAAARRAVEALDGGVLVNGYGPTENTTFSACHRMQRAEDVGERVSIGRPVSGSRARVLGDDLDPLPPGAIGELYVGGEGLARGYLGRPALTASRFLPDPFAPEPGARLYRTGDLARWRPDGTLDFLGRADDQVKIRGFRVEPAELEVVLGGQPEVGEAAVVVERSRGEARLAAFAVPREGGPPPGGDPAPLLARLRRELPAYMVPSSLTLLEALPRKPNGKLDRARLRERAAGASLPAAEPAPPRTDTERALAGIFEEVLGVDGVGREDDVFDLGGHSLTALQVVSRIQKAFGRELPLRRIFEAPTVAALAAVVDALGESAAPAAPPIPTRRDRTRYRVAARTQREEG